MTVKTVNYTDEQTAELVNRYQAGDTVEALAEAFGKSVKSVVAKLTREKVYVAKTKATGTGRVTKAALTSYLEDLFQLEAGSLESLTKAEKGALEALANAATSRVN